MRPVGGGGTAIVLSGGGLLGAVQVGMIRALVDVGVRPDLVLGTSVGAVNGAVLAATPAEEVADLLESLWRAPETRSIFAGGPVGQVREMARSGIAVHSPEPLRQALLAHLGCLRIEDLPIPFQCCAARIEDAAEHWFDSGSVVDAVLASAAVPGLFPPAQIGEHHYLDGGLVNSIPLGRAVELGAERVFVLQVGRFDQPLRPPRRPWEVGLVAFEIARRHRFARDLAAVPDDVEVHVLPVGEVGAPRLSSRSSLRYRNVSATGRRIAAAHDAASAYLRTVR